MSDFTVNIGRLRSSALLLDSIGDRAARISEEIGEACRMGGADSESMRAAIQAAMKCGRSARELSVSVIRFGRVLESCSQLYENCENKIIASAVNESNTAASSGDGGTTVEVTVNHPAGQESLTTHSHTVVANPGAVKPRPNGAGGGSYSNSWEYNGGGELFNWHYSGAPGQSGEGDKPAAAGSGNEPAQALKPPGNPLHVWNTGVEASGSVAEGSIQIPGGWLSGTAVGGEAHAEAGLGLYAPGNQGSNMFAPFINASAGASASLLEGEISSSYSNDYVSVGATGNAALGHAEASAEVAASLFDENGSISPALSGSASAEAVAVSATGTVSGSAAGISATATGGVNLGIGAHANFGVTPTSISCDVGASLGIGASFGFTVDIGGAVEAVCSTAQAVWNYFFPGD